MLNLQFEGTSILNAIIGIVALIIYLGIITGIIIFLVKAVKYFIRQEVLLKEINEKLGNIENNTNIDGAKTTI